MSKSVMANLFEKALRFLKPKVMDSQVEVTDFLENRENSDKPVKSIFKSYDFRGMQVFRFGDENSRKVILYMHGGAYVNQINLQHYLYCSLLARKLDVYVLAPVYPLAPFHSASESFELISDFYRSLLDEDINITLMGDSAGGGFVLSFCQHLKTIDLAQPDKIVVFSPWVDVSMSNSPYDNDNDPILGEIGLREMGKSWAGELDSHDYRVSPLFGDNTNFPETMIFAGTNEIFYKDICLYVDNLKKDNVNVRFITEEGLFHIYPLFPIPEAKKAFKEIKNEIM